MWSKESIEEDTSGSGFSKTNFMLINQGLAKFYKKVRNSYHILYRWVCSNWNVSQERI